MRQRTAAAVLILFVIVLSCLSHAPVHAQTAGADGSLVVAALQVLKNNYFRPVEATTLLNAAVVALRKATKQGADVIPDIPPGVTEGDAVGMFRKIFDQAVNTGTLPAQDLAYTATREMLASLQDSHVFYLDPKRFKEKQDAFAGRVKYEGIGVFIKIVKAEGDTNAVFVEEVFPGSPAAAAGVKPFDRITQVNGSPLAPTATPQDVADLVRGPAGSSVALTVKRSGQTLTITAVRGPVQMVPVEAHAVRPGIVYVKLNSFSDGVGNRLRESLKTLLAQGTIRAVVLDLRGNWGGYLREAESVAGIFSPQQARLARILRRDGPTELVARGEQLLPNAALAVLTDKFTASSSEVLVQGLRHAHRATVIGEKTAGSLGWSDVFPLPAGGMYVTIYQVVGPENEQIERVGIAPDTPVDFTFADMERAVDPQLDAALRTVGGMVVVPALVAVFSARAGADRGRL